VLFLVALGSSGYAHYELFQPYMTSEPFSAEGGTPPPSIPSPCSCAWYLPFIFDQGSLAGGIQHLRREGLRKAYPIEVPFPPFFLL